METITTHLEQIIRKSIEIYMESKSIWRIFFLPFFILMLLSLILFLLPYSSVFAGASFLRFDLYPETDFIIFTAILLALICAFSYCSIVAMVIAKNYVITGRITFTLNNFEGKLLYVISSYILLYIFASLLSVVIVWLPALNFGILTFFVKLVILAIWFAIFMMFWFTPQAIVLDNRSLKSAMSASSKFIATDYRFISTFVVLAAIVMEILYLLGSLHWTLLGIAYIVNFMVVLPLLIVVQTVIYLTRYTLRRISLDR